MRPQTAGPGGGGAASTAGDLDTLSVLYEATRKIGLSDSLDDLLDTVLGEAQKLIGFDHCALMLYDPDREQLIVKRARGYRERREEIVGLILERGEGLSGWAVDNRTPVRVGDVTEDPRYVPGLPEARSNLAVPLVVGNEVAGAINVESENFDAFTERDQKLLTVLGAQAALSIVAHRARERLQGRFRQLDALYRISRLASYHRDLDDTLAALVEIAGEIVPAGEVAIFLLNEEDRTLRLRASTGEREETGEVIVPLGRGVSGRCAVSGQMVVADDVRRDPDYVPGLPGARSAIALPLLVEGEVIGVLEAESPETRAYGEEERHTLSMVAHQAGAVLQTVRLHEETRRLAITDPLTGLFNRRHFVSQMEEHVRRAKRYGDGLALLLLDNDRLKEINDRFGHHYGDQALQRVAELLEQTLRETDDVARIGGDEFAVLLLQTGEKLALEVADRIWSELEQLQILTEAGEPIEISLSGGMAFFPRDARDAKTLLRRADEALYSAKRSGRQRLAVYGGEDLDESPPEPANGNGDAPRL